MVSWFYLLRKIKKSLDILNHSAAHLLAEAVSNLYPGAKFWVGPAIEGFYYDIDFLDKQITEEDLVKIEKEMIRLSNIGAPIIKKVLLIKKLRNYFLIISIN